MDRDLNASRHAVLVHLSDLHFRVGTEGREERNGYLRDKLVDDLPGVIAKTEARAATAVVVTGDITFSGKKEQFVLARDWLIGVCELVGAHPTRLLCVPGNHDVDRSKIGPTHRAHRAEIAGCNDHQLDQLIDEYLAEPGQPILTPLEAYIEFASGSNCELGRRLHWDIPLPLGDRYVLAFRGATSVINSGPGADGQGSLAMHKNQLLLHRRPGQINVFLSHHDPYFWSRHPLLPKPPAAGAAIAMYGHTHSPHAETVDECLQVTAGAVQPDEGGDWNPTYNVIELQVEEPGGEHAILAVRLWRRRFSQEAGCFVPDAHGEHCLTRSVRVPAAPPSPVPVKGPIDGGEEEVRVALSTTEGSPQPLREVMLALARLGAGQRARVLDELGLLDDFLAEMPQRQLIPVAARAIVENGKTESFLSIVEALEQRP